VTRFVLGRVLAAIGVLIVLVVAVFSLQRVSDADPVRADLGPSATEEVVAAQRAELGYDDPIPTQVVRYLGQVMQGDLGESIRTDQPVSDDLRRALPATLELIAFAMSVAVLGGVALGVLTTKVGRRTGSVRGSMTAMNAVPPFLIAIVGVLVFSRTLGWLPISGRTQFLDAPTEPTGFMTIDGLLAGRLDVAWDAVMHMIVPAVALSIAPMVAIARVLRMSLLSVQDSDYVRTARSKGIGSRRVLVRHSLRNAAGPALSLTGLLLAGMFAGAVVVEQIVAWPGVGAYLLRSIQSSDYPSIAGVTIVIGLAFVLVNAAVEVVQRLMDPRMSAS